MRSRADRCCCRQGVQKMMAGQATPQEVAAEVTEGIATYHAPFRN